jgi:3-methylcrotonyl-CoA carboxylase alpha subunit
VLRDHPVPAPTALNSPWTTLVSRRFGGDVYERTVTFESATGAAEGEEAETKDPERVSVAIKCLSGGLFDIRVRTAQGEKEYKGVSAHLVSPTTIASTLDSKSRRTTIVSQPPPPSLPASRAPNANERLHVFSSDGAGPGLKTTLVVPSPGWLVSLGTDVLSASAGSATLRAPMPSVVVEVKVAVGQTVAKGDPVVVLESMKTETVLRARQGGVVSSIGCAKGEMVPEGKVLVDFEEDKKKA